MTNRLAAESSPYLRQHAGNPVDWYPWGEEAFARARDSGKPIFLSVGYATCHWCHVMERESFENEAIAALLNQHFVSIKVDREERPGVDRLYMSYVQATTGHGGWPMSVFLTPELAPFYGGTYFPPDERHGQPGFSRVLTAIAGMWSDQRAKIEAQGEEVLARLGEHLSSPSAGALPADPLADGVAAARRQFDAEAGGFGQAPKFPRPAGLDLLLARIERSADAEARAMLVTTLEAMASGGLYDHLGGGFHRYSVDRTWHVPHYEKMLYDQGQLLATYARAWALTRREVFANVVSETVAYLERDLGLEHGAWAAAEDADSDRADGSHGEGAFYVWSRDELVDLFGDEADAVAAAFAVTAEGNSPPGSDPHGELTGWNTLLRRTPADAELLERARGVLFAARRKRPRPLRDDKVVTAWNGLAIAGVAEAAWVFDRSDWLAAAERAFTAVEGLLWDESAGQLHRSWLDRPGATAVAADYACLATAALALYRASGDDRWLARAVRFQGRMDALFWDQAAGGWYDTPADAPHLRLRLKEDYDGAEPTPSAIGARNCLILAAATHDPAWQERGEAAVVAFAGDLQRQPWAAPAMAVAAELVHRPPRSLVLVGTPGAPDTVALEAVARRGLARDDVVLRLDPAARPELGAHQRHLADMLPIDGRATAYLCHGRACRAPTAEPVDLARQLAE